MPIKTEIIDTLYSSKCLNNENFGGCKCYCHLSEILDILEIMWRQFEIKYMYFKILLIKRNDPLWSISYSHHIVTQNVLILDDTIPLDKGTSKLELSDSNRTYYGSEMSLSSEKKSSNLSVRILYEVIKLTESNSESHGKKDVTLRYKN